MKELLILVYGICLGAFTSITIWATLWTLLGIFVLGAITKLSVELFDWPLRKSELKND